MKALCKPLPSTRAAEVGNNAAGRRLNVSYSKQPANYVCQLTSSQQRQYTSMWTVVSHYQGGRDCEQCRQVALLIRLYKAVTGSSLASLAPFLSLHHLCPENHKAFAINNTWSTTNEQYPTISCAFFHIFHRRFVVSFPFIPLLVMRLMKSRLS